MSKTPFKKTEEQWRKILDDESYRVMREKGTEYPYTGEYNLHFEMALMLVKAAKNLFLLVITSLKVIVVGRVFPNQLMVKFATNPIKVMA